MGVLCRYARPSLVSGFPCAVGVPRGRPPSGRYCLLCGRRVRLGRLDFHHRVVGRFLRLLGFRGSNRLQGFRLLGHLPARRVPRPRVPI